MKIQELAIIFVIIILPISILLSEYTQFQIQTIKTQTEYDSKLTTATYDAIKAFQLNAQNETYSGLANERVKEIERSVNSFRNSLISSFKLNGYTEDELNNYIPALVYTLYDGLYIYSPYENTNYRYEYENNPYTGEPEYITDASGNKIPTEGNGEQLYGLKPYISYSCRYKKGNIDVVITYALDNYITVQGMLDDKYINKSGYLIDNIKVNGGSVSYNDVEIEIEQLKEHIGRNSNPYPYVKRNGVKYYLVNNQIVSISNSDVKVQCSEGEPSYDEWVNLIKNNTYAQQYYKDAYEFTKWFKSTDLVTLTYSDANDEVIDENTGVTSIRQIWPENTAKVFDFNTGINPKDNIENELSNFNQHRLAVIRHKIETNLAIAISNYNEYAGENIRNVFQMPQIKENEWEQITHNISLISFLQGLPIGGKIYNGYTIVTNSESKEVVLEKNIYILGKDNDYHKIGDNSFSVEDSGVYSNTDGKKIGAGRLNTDFKRQSLTNREGYQTLYYYPLKAYNASYNSIVMQNNVTTYDDIYEYVNTQSDDELKEAFYTALGRERYGMKLSVMPETYTVTYEGNGGVVAKHFDIKTHGVDLTLAPKPTRSGYEFVMWNTKVDGTGDSYGPGGKYSKDENVTLYAVWKQKLGPLTVTYELNGGTWTNPHPTMLPVTPGNIITLPSAPIRSGYKFEGWVLVRQSLINSPVFPAGSRYTVNEDITFKAKWVEVSTM